MATRQPECIDAMALVAGAHRFPDSNREAVRNYPPFEQLPPMIRDYLVTVHAGGETQAQAVIAAFRTLADDRDMDLVPERLSKIRARTLVIWGDRDELLPLDLALELYRAIPTVALWIVPNQGHFLLIPDWGGSPQATTMFPAVVMEYFRASEPSG